MRLSKSERHVRNWVPGLTKAAGAAFGDAIRNITGDAAHVTFNTTGVFTGAFYGTYLDAEINHSGDAEKHYKVFFDASRVVPTGPENVPVHVYLPHVVYLGRPK
jgi:hypothetical protein